MAADPLETLVALAERLQARCLTAGLSVATAESCTGGLVANVITEIAGSSDYFRGGVVCYSNRAKEDLLAVPGSTLSAHGAVSAQVARAMATGARDRFGVDLAVSVTGVAGPGGGSDDKPVGLTYVGAASADGVVVRRFAWSGDRRANKRASAEAALDLLIELAGGSGTSG